MKTENAETLKSPVRKPRKRAPPSPQKSLTRRFAALDFETADYGRDSACALSIVIVENGQVVQTRTELIRPPRQEFYFTYLHGISWSHVKNKPPFGELWPDLQKLLDQVDFVAAHNATFDRSVLRACCETAQHEHVRLPFLCTVKLAREVWNLFPTTLAHVAHHLHIPLKHHDAASDALACAQIVIKALEKGHSYEDILKKHALKPSKK
jgi:DNA polymerase III subunit epsilon